MQGLNCLEERRSSNAQASTPFAQVPANLGERGEPSCHAQVPTSCALPSRVLGDQASLSQDLGDIGRPEVCPLPHSHGPEPCTGPPFCIPPISFSGHRHMIAACAGVPARGGSSCNDSMSSRIIAPALAGGAVRNQPQQRQCWIAERLTVSTDSGCGDGSQHPGIEYATRHAVVWELPSGSTQACCRLLAELANSN